MFDLDTWKKTLEPTRSEVARTLAALLAPGQITELRILGDWDTQWPTPSRYSGDRLPLVADNAGYYDREEGVRGIYFMMNPVRAGLMQPATDADILHRRWMLVDVDPVRPADVSSTDAEKKEAVAVAEAVRVGLGRLGWPSPVAADSGNGYHLLYRIELSNTAEVTALVRRVLAALAARLDTSAAKIDTKVYNAARIVRLYGTHARKGADTPDRPHRRSRLLEVPEPLEAVGVELLEKVAGWVPVPVLQAPPSPLARPGARPAGPSGLGVKRIYQPKIALVARAKNYISKRPPAISGQAGHTAIFRVALDLVRGFRLGNRAALKILIWWNDLYARPPFHESDLWRKIEQAEKEGRVPWGYLDM
jgi:hypothetical protein